MRGKTVRMVIAAGAVAALCGCAMTQKRVKAANLNIADLDVALALYYSDTGRYPSEQEGLAALLHPVRPGASPYITRIPADPWGGAYRYRLIDNTPRIESAGPDGIFGTADDMHD